MSSGLNGTASAAAGDNSKEEPETPISPLSPPLSNRVPSNPFSYDYVEDYGPEYHHSGYGFIDVEDGLYGGNTSLSRYPEPKLGSGSRRKSSSKTEWPLRNLVGSGSRRKSSPLWDRIYEEWSGVNEWMNEWFIRLILRKRGFRSGAGREVIFFLFRLFFLLISFCCTRWYHFLFLFTIQRFDWHLRYGVPAGRERNSLTHYLLTSTVKSLFLFLFSYFADVYDYGHAHAILRFRGITIPLYILFFDGRRRDGGIWMGGYNQHSHCEWSLNESGGGKTQETTDEQKETQRNIHNTHI
jgi:hypothetical protein